MENLPASLGFEPLKAPQAQDWSASELVVFLVPPSPPCDKKWVIPTKNWIIPYKMGIAAVVEQSLSAGARSEKDWMGRKLGKRKEMAILGEHRQ